MCCAKWKKLKNIYFKSCGLCPCEGQFRREEHEITVL